LGQAIINQHLNDCRDRYLHLRNVTVDGRTDTSLTGASLPVNVMQEPERAQLQSHQRDWLYLADLDLAVPFSSRTKPKLALCVAGTDCGLGGRVHVALMQGVVLSEN
jgi:hypothetical protein